MYYYNPICLTNFLWNINFKILRCWKVTTEYLWLLWRINHLPCEFTWFSMHTNCNNLWRQWQPTPVLLPGKIPWAEEPGRLQSMGSLRVGHNWATSLSLFTFMHWRRKWQPTPVFLPGESQGRRSLVSCRLWGRTESDTTEVTKQQQ